MAATIWKGRIRFGDIDLPVKLHAAVKENRVRFHLLHQRDGVKLQQQWVCALENAPVTPAETVKAFEVAERRYLPVDPGEFEAAAPESSRLIEVHEFVAAARIDPIFLERAYHLSPDAQPHGYHALAMALNEMEVAGVCTWTMRKRPYLGVLQTRGRFLRLQTLRYADEVMPVSSLDLQEFPLSEKELAIGGELIRHLTVPFDPLKFADEHRQKLQELLAQKARGEKIALLAPKRLRPTAPDKLLEALEASLKKVA